MIKLENRLQDPVLPQRLERELTFTPVWVAFSEDDSMVSIDFFFRFFFNVHHSKVFIEFITILFLVFIFSVFLAARCVGS